ncbi:MAG: hypothetical protein ACN4GG_02655 [Akkermansiaceae bacterium]
MKFSLHFIFLLADSSLALGPAGEDYLDDGGGPMLFFFLLIALMKKRFFSGFRALHYQVCALLALPCGIGAVWFGRMLFHWGLSNATVMLSGTLIGISAGLGLAFF